MAWNSQDALLITFYGIFVVFSGLILTSILIFLFSLPEKLFKKKDKAVLSTKEKKKLIIENKAPEKPIKEATPEVMAVIITVLEAEMRLNKNMLGN